ncbi:MAG: M28 family metallopeptidase [Dehalococcoidia bacterium]|nr:M28 family metallopeptidase [Dehalococcoidia bacterium]
MLQPFPVRSFEQLRADLSVAAPEARTIPAEALTFSTGGTLAAAVVPAGLGRPQDFPPDTAGKIALVQRGEIFFEDKVENAADAGALAAIIYNNQPGDLHASLGDESRIPAVAVDQAYGQALVDLLAAGPVTVRLDVETRISEAQSQNVVARPPGQACRVIAGGHYDSVPQGPGANDNGSGTATVIEMARTLAADGEFDPVCFALFGSEEVGLIGSAFYAGSLSEEERSQVKGMLNFDMLAVGGSWPLSGSREIVDAAAAEAQQLGLDYSTESGPPAGTGSDHASFIDAGIPAILFNCFCDEHYHTAEDRFEFVQEGRLAEAGALGLGVIARLLGAP